MLILQAKQTLQNSKEHFSGYLKNMPPPNKEKVTRALWKAIMTRSRLRNRDHGLNTDDSLQSFKRQREFL